ncbi:MAG TPA: hypothetical protein VGB87_17070, partial [Vicinamibacteria bacterium]
MSDAVPARPVSAHRRRARLAMAAGALAFAAVTVAVFLGRRPPEEYVPGREVERGTEITRSLDRPRPREARADEGRPDGAAAPRRAGAPAGALAPAERPGEVVFE